MFCDWSSILWSILTLEDDDDLNTFGGVLPKFEHGEYLVVAGLATFGDPVFESIFLTSDIKSLQSFESFGKQSNIHKINKFMFIFLPWLLNNLFSRK